MQRACRHPVPSCATFSARGLLGSLRARPYRRPVKMTRRKGMFLAPRFAFLAALCLSLPTRGNRQQGCLLGLSCVPRADASQLPPEHGEGRTEGVQLTALTHVF